MKILVMEYPMPWHHSQHMVSYLKSLGHELDFVDLRNFDKYLEYYTIDAKYDMVITGQPDASVFLLKNNPNTKIVLYCAEGYWSPGIMNPDYLITTFPEMIERYKKMYPFVFFYCGDRYKEFSLWINRDLYNYNEPKTIKGICFMGILDVLLGKKGDRNGGGYFRLYREAYKERKDFILSNQYTIKDGKKIELIHIFPQEYSDKYIKWVSKTEANLPTFAYLSYFSKRPLENAAAGSINIFNIRDEYDIKYINEAGFYDMVNCMFVRTKEDLERFYRLSDGVKESMRINALELIKERYDPNIVWSKILDWVMNN